MFLYSGTSVSEHVLFPNLACENKDSLSEAYILLLQNIYNNDAALQESLVIICIIVLFGHLLLYFDAPHHWASLTE